MSNIDLIILGMVKAQPQNAYEIKKNLEYRCITKWVRISVPSIYKKVLQLEKSGYLVSRIEKQEKMPDKTIYEITENGNNYFNQLMEECSKNEINLFLDFNTIIVNLDLVDYEQKIIYIKNIKNRINELKVLLSEKSIQRQHIPFVGKSIFEQQIAMVNVLEEWLNHLETEIL